MTVKPMRKDKNNRGKPVDPSAKVNALPNTFKFAAQTLETMSEKGGSVGSIVVSKYKNYNYKLIFALVMNTVKNIKIIKKIIHEVKLAKKVPEDNTFLLEILVGDLLYGKGLKSVEQNSLAAAIIGLKESIVKQQTLLKKTHSSENVDQEVKYLRINHLKINDMAHVLSQLKTVGLSQLDYSKDKIKFKKYINKFKSMDEKNFMVDFHFPKDLIILKPSAADKIKKTELIKKGKVMLQDKASFMAVEALGVEKGHMVIDACSAPGCKTSLIASKMKNSGKIFAFDVDKKRLLAANHLLKLNGVTCAKTEITDFSKVKLARLAKANKIEIFDSILLDPSCSGSGIQSRVDYKATSEEIGRLKKLQAFQVSLLKHALKAKISKAIVYCTCSQSIEENEQVVEMALNESGVKSDWQVEEILPYWPQRGNESFEFGSKCIRSDATNLTNGFFIAKLNFIGAAGSKEQDVSKPIKIAEVETELDADEDEEQDENMDSDDVDEEEDDDEDVSGNEEEDEDEDSDEEDDDDD